MGPLPGAATTTALCKTTRMNSLPVPLFANSKGTVKFFCRNLCWWKNAFDKGVLKKLAFSQEGGKAGLGQQDGGTGAAVERGCGSALSCLEGAQREHGQLPSSSAPGFGPHV